jgi:hypothetical protein
VNFYYGVDNVYEKYGISIHHGIVLRSYIPKQYKLIILDNIFGKIVCTYQARSFSYGIMIEYIPLTLHRVYKINTAQIIHAPCNLAKDNLEFFHHILELSYYFIPLDNPVPEIFDLLSILYRIDYKFCSLLFQSAFIGKFFVLLGITPQENADDAFIINTLRYRSLEELVAQLSCTQMSSILKNWIYRCIAEHPRMHYFKTLAWLKGSDIT